MTISVQFLFKPRCSGLHAFAECDGSVLTARRGERRGVLRVLVRKSEGKRPLGRPRCRWEDNIRTDLQGDPGVDGRIIFGQIFRETQV